MSALPKTWDLLTGVETSLKRIRTADGYYTDAGTAVTFDLGQIPAEEDFVLAVGLGGLARSDQAAYAGSDLGQSVEVLVVAKMAASLPQAQITLHKLIDDVMKAMRGNQRDFPMGIRKPAFQEARPIVPEAGLAWIGAEIRFASHVTQEPRK